MIERHLVRFVAPNPHMEPSNILRLLFYRFVGSTRAVTTDGLAVDVLQCARNSSSLCSMRKLRVDVEFVRYALFVSCRYALAVEPLPVVTWVGYY